MRAGRERGCPEPCPAGGSRVRDGGCGVTAGCAGAAARSRARVNRALPRPPRAGCGPTGAGAGGASEVPVCYCYCYCYCCCCVRAETTQGVSSSVFWGVLLFPQAHKARQEQSTSPGFTAEQGAQRAAAAARAAPTAGAPLGAREKRGGTRRQRRGAVRHSRAFLGTGGS